ncbi:M20/M25/M40 family metallo-hydrolase [Usitatibacter palustris]|uniref:Succinyl-diaminopimelate desuccinylase n=1 Tax=Usitatibacter palustris TaxID=2732487 RepID=A0A6M4HDQ3_9PROT|nr:M20/M25/M40 family metallo-hydrolase [Usitatibacter palustris]QJR16633.1 Succinyl-diaminopimelate desuccinylase [Usitatibacter palustris]
MTNKWPCGALALAATFLSGAASAQSASPHQQLTRDIYRELIEIRTVHPDGDNTAAARAMARRLLDAGFDPKDVEVLEPAPRKGNLVARLRGTGELKPVMLLAHIDVVEAKKEDWSDGLDPFKLTEKDGYFYGRGTIDDKAQAAIFIANLVRAHKAGWKPKRDVIVALTADEEGGTTNGVTWLIANRRDAIDAEFAINEGGNLVLRDGKPYELAVQVSEKIPFTYELAATNAGGHSSLPRADNAIYDLVAALDRLSRHQFPARSATGDQLRRAVADPSLNAQLRTTCVATRLEAGHASNALPQTAKATVNCRMLPNENPQDLQRTLVTLAGERVAVKALYDPKPSPPSDPDSKAMKTIRRVAAATWPGVVVTPTMSAGATDGSRLRVIGIPVYGVAGIAMEVERMHGRDERLEIGAFHQAIEFLDRLVRELASGG